MKIPEPKTNWVSAVTMHMAVLEWSKDEERRQTARQEIKTLAEFVDGLGDWDLETTNRIKEEK